MLSACSSARRFLAGCAVILLLPSASLADVPIEQKLQQVLTDFLEEHPERGGPFAGGLGLGPYQYCHGIFASEHAGYTIFSHPGARGTVGGYVPSLDLSFGVSISMLDMEGEQNTLVHRLIDVLAE